jgi:hypothetical protein
VAAGYHRRGVILKEPCDSSKRSCDTRGVSKFERTRSNAAKNLLLMLANAVAALVFIYFGAVRWLVALSLAVGFLIGGRLGPVIVRRAPPAPLRLLVALAGLALALDLGWKTYSAVAPDARPTLKSARSALVPASR